MSIKTNLVALMSVLVLSSPCALAKEIAEPPAPGSGGGDENAKAVLAKNLYSDGVRRYNNKEYDVALKRLNTACELDSKCIGAFYYRGMTYKKLGKADAARKDFKTATGLTAYTIEDFELRGKSFDECGNKTAANSDYAKAKALAKKVG